MRRRQKQPEHVPEFYICPKCARGRVSVIARDHYGKPLYQCPRCENTFVESSLEYADRQRRLLD